MIQQEQEKEQPNEIFIAVNGTAEEGYKAVLKWPKYLPEGLTSERHLTVLAAIRKIMETVKDISKKEQTTETIMNIKTPSGYEFKHTYHYDWSRET